MLRFRCIVRATLVLFLLASFSICQEAGRANPDSLCVHSTTEATAADADVWITLPDHHYLGSPAFSPDGEWIAFDAYRSDTLNVASEVWIVKSDGSDARKVTTGATPRWSPDGKRLLFMREQRNPGDQQQHGIFVVNRDGTDEQFLCEGRWPDWSPDGRHIVFSRGTTDTRGGAQQFARIYTANADGSDPELLANGDCPAWSPDGRTIACSYRDPAFPAPMIRTIDTITHRQQFIGYGWYRPNWAADSRSLTTNGATADRSVGPVRLSVRGPNDAPATVTDVDGAMSACFSADGRLLVFAAPHGDQ